MFWLLLKSACTASKFSLFLTLLPQWVQGGWAKVWEGMQVRQLIWNDWSDIPYHVVSCSPIKMCGNFFKVAIVQKLAEHWSAHGKSLLLEHLFVFSPPPPFNYWTLYLNPWDFFSCFCSSNSFPHPTGGKGKGGASRVLPANINPPQNARPWARRNSRLSWLGERHRTWKN